MNALTGQPTHPDQPQGSFVHASPRDAWMESAWIRSGGEWLAASVDLPRSGPPWPVAMLVHGFTGNRIGRSYHFVDIGRALAQRGIACVRFDQAGCGESTGDHTAVSLLSIERDCTSVHEWLASDGRFDLDRLGIIGASMGSFGGVAVDARFGSRCIALLAPVFDLGELVEGKTAGHDVAGALATIGFVPFRGLRLGQKYFEHLRFLDMREMMTSGRSPVLILHTDEDETVEVSHGRRIADVCKDAGRLCEMPAMKGFTHDFHEEPWRGQSIRAMTGWMSRWLGT